VKLKHTSESVAVGTVALSLSALWVAGVAGYITHVVWCIQMLIAGEPLQNSHLFLAGLGLFFPPAGAIHGVMIWFGVGA
jgi:hypothetical protein